MTKPMNTISRKTERRRVALAHLKRDIHVKKAYFGKDKAIATLEARIAAAPKGKVSTKKDRSSKGKKGQV